MAYRYTARGTLEFSKENINQAVSILDEKNIRYRRMGNSLCIEHDERADAPSHRRADEAFRDLAVIVDRPQAINEWNELLGESELGFVDGTVRRDASENVWSVEEKVPSPDDIVEGLRKRGLAARVSKIYGSKKGGKRTRVFEIQPGSGGPGCRCTVKRRFWDSYDLLSVPDVSRKLCDRYGLLPEELRERLHGARFGIEVRKPALGGISSELLYRSLLEVLEDLTDGIRTPIG